LPKTITITLDDADERHVAQAIALRQTARDDKGCILSQGESDLTGAVIAEICRGWLDMLGQLPPITIDDVVESFTGEPAPKREPPAKPIIVALVPSDEGGYTAAINSMPGCISEGETVPESLRNLAEAVELWQEPFGEGNANND